MQDDVYMIVSDGWKDAAQPTEIVDDKNNKSKEQADFTVGRQKFKAELIPPALIIARYFGKEAAAIEGMEAEVAVLEQKLEELTEEQSGEEGLLSDAMDEGKIPKGAVAALLKKSNPKINSSEEIKVWKYYLELSEEITGLNKELKNARADLDTKVAAQYGKVSEAEIKVLVVEDKWLATLAASVQSELDRVSQALTGRVRVLAERYGTPLPQVLTQVEELEKRVAGHLEKMGFRV